eukprot:GHVT01082444.1.p1 GENE.GHVT01082444.1~~GHVT01082444.1.p1  ORF type:complete len:268 (+),score=41.10 GHVT01082444.1:814-1617(+)
MIEAIRKADAVDKDSVFKEYNGDRSYLQFMSFFNRAKHEMKPDFLEVNPETVCAWLEKVRSKKKRPNSGEHSDSPPSKERLMAKPKILPEKECVSKGNSSTTSSPRLFTKQSLSTGSPQSNRRLAENSYRLVGPDVFPRAGAFNFRTEYAEDGAELWCCDFFQTPKFYEEEARPTAQPPNATPSYSSALRGFANPGGTSALCAGAAIALVVAFVFLKKTFWSSGGKKRVDRGRHNRRGSLRGHRPLAFPEESETDPNDPSFIRNPRK